MRKLIYSLLWAVCGMSAAPAQAQHAFRVMEYNVENLFDCRHDSLKQDTEFLPGSVRNWTYRRFQDKVNKIGKVILAAGKEQVPDLVGLCEINLLVDRQTTRSVGVEAVSRRLLYTPISARYRAFQSPYSPQTTTFAP